MYQREVFQTRSPYDTATSGRRLGADEVLDLRDDVVDLEVGRVDPLRVGCRLHAHAVRLVAQLEVGRERIGADVGALGLAPASAHGGVGHEIDLHGGVGR